VEIQPIVVGTAGHIDHGKSSLVKALTGIDPDRLKEEIERGMTIDLGFARFALPDGRTVGIVDVPGHERFVKNMVAGATGIDLVILVVAADDGVMPQTREHLAIMSLLGVRRGFVALTKIDAVSREMTELAADDVASAVRGTFLEGAPIQPVSSTSGEGIGELRALLQRMAAETPPRSPAGVFRMPIQRVFSAPGFGTIVTGIPVSGSVGVGDPLEIMPQGLRGKVRGIQAYHQATDRARAGHSTAINLSDVDHHAVTRGSVAAAVGYFKGVRMIGAKMQALASLDRPIEDRTPVRLHTGTAEAVGEIVLLDCEALEPGASALVQVRLAEPIVCAPADRFVLRLESPAYTLGGGVILEESKHRLKRFKGFIVEELTRQAAGLASPRELLEVVLSRAPLRLMTSESLAIEIKRPKNETERLLGELKESRHAASPGASGRWIHTARLEQAATKFESALADWFREHAHREVVDIRDLRRVTALDTDLLDVLVAELEQRGRLRREPGGLIRPAGRSADLDPGTSARYASVLAAFAKARFQPPSPDELARGLSVPLTAVRAALELCLDRGLVQRIAPDLYLTRELHDEARAAIVENCGKHGSLDIPALRDKLATTRKFLIPLLEHFDAQGLTLRQGANRVLKRR
jgi:selenocysteine-specific elongation factor